jgi:hypothetical protein
MDVHFYAFLNLALDWIEWSASCSGHFIPRESVSDAHGTGRGWTGTGAGLNSSEKRKPLVPAANRTYISRLSTSLA